MRYVKKIAVSGTVWFMMCAVVVLVSAVPCMAAENGWRPTYDLVMRWINFGIMAALAVRLLKTPLMNFLKSQSDVAAEQIRLAELEKEKAEARIAETKRQIEENEERVEEIRARILRQGELKKQQILEEAQEHSRIMIEEANRRITSRLVNAQARYRAELVDTAVSMALERLPKMITDADQSRYVDIFIENARQNG